MTNAPIRANTLPDNSGVKHETRIRFGSVFLTLLATTAQAQDRSVLPIPEPAFDGRIAETGADSQPATPRPVRAPQGAPKCFLFMSDDVGFAMSGTFGGPVPTPNFDRIAAQGQRYNRFHTTGICSPTRAALLTGRNTHNAATGYLTDLASNYPGYHTRLPAETATDRDDLAHERLFHRDVWQAP